jgi:peptidase, S41 family
MEGTPAEEAGLKENDIIIKVNDIDVRDKNLTDTVKEIKGKENTDVVITVIRDGKEQSIKVARKEIQIDSTAHELLENGIGYLDIKSFSENSASDVEKAIEDLRKKGMTKLIIDLRFNGGGDVRSTIKIANLFLDKDKEIYSTINGKNFKKTVYTEKNAKYNFDIVILANKYSASASELLTAALKENKRVKEVVGETTYGKGVIQGVYPSSTGGALKATIEEYFGPGELKLNNKGVEPTIKVEQPKIDKKEILKENEGKTDEELKKILMKKDIQLQKAIEVLQQ